MAKLPWFKFYVQDWITDPRVLALTNEQRGIFHWLLCRQWLDGDLPGDLMHIYPLLPPGSDSAAVGYVVQVFFPPDPDTTRRSNPKLAEQQALRAAAYANLTKGAAVAREAKERKYRQDKQFPVSDSRAGFRSRSKNQKTEEDVVGIPPLVWEALKPFAEDPKTRTARIGQVRGLLQGMTDKPVSPEAMARGLTDFLANGGNWSAIGIRAFALKAEKLLQGEAGRRAAQGDSSILGQPDANTGHWSEDELA